MPMIPYFLYLLARGCLSVSFNIVTFLLSIYVINRIQGRVLQGIDIQGREPLRSTVCTLYASDATPTSLEIYFRVLALKVSLIRGGDIFKHAG